MTNQTIPAPLAQDRLAPQNIYADAYLAEVDGVAMTVAVCFDRGDRSVGIQPGYLVEIGDVLSLARPDEWAEAHPGVPATDENMRAVVAQAIDEIEQQAADWAHDHPEEPDCEDFAVDDYDYDGCNGMQEGY
jgi:hypothetical protein